MPHPPDKPKVKWGIGRKKKSSSVWVSARSTVLPFLCCLRSMPYFGSLFTGQLSSKHAKNLNSKQKNKRLNRYCTSQRQKDFTSTRDLHFECRYKNPTAMNRDVFSFLLQTKIYISRFYFIGNRDSRLVTSPPSILRCFSLMLIAPPTNKSFNIHKKVCSQSRQICAAPSTPRVEIKGVTQQRLQLPEGPTLNVLYTIFDRKGDLFIYFP